MALAPDPADKLLDAQADGAFSGRQEPSATSHRAGYTDPLGWALKQARKGATLQAGEGLLLVKHYEAQVATALALAEQCLAAVRAAHTEATYLTWADSTSRRHAVQLRLQLDALRGGDAQSGPA